MKKILFIDRDGTLIVEPGDTQQIDSLEKLEFIPGVFGGLSKVARTNRYELVMVTNQDGLGTSSFPETDFWPAHNKTMTSFSNEGIHFAAVHIDRSTPGENKPTRKPGIGMLLDYVTNGFDLANSFVIGDRLTDLELARNLKCNGILFQPPGASPLPIPDGLRATCVLTTSSWEDIARFLLAGGRRAEVTRKTKETSITVRVDLEGSGASNISTGLGFFDHMLEQVARHGAVDLDVKTTGDLHIDEHHTIEDTAITLGEAFLKALGDKKGMERYGFSLPMDDCLAQVAIDFGGRPWLVWEATFNREKVGDMPTEMFHHFFKSFADAARCNLNIKAEGANEHHKIEAIFKAFAKSMKMAARRDPGSEILPSTKGTL